MNKGKLQGKQETLKSLHCPSPQSSLFNSRSCSFRSQFFSLIFHSPALNPDQSAKSSSFGSQHKSKCATPSPKNSDESAIRCSQYKSKCVIRCLQRNDELVARSPQQSDESVANCPQRLFIDVSTELLRQGKNVRFRAPGLSMNPTIKEGETITVAPIAPFDIKRGDILLYKVGKKVIAHRVVSIEREKSDSTSHSSALNPQHIFTLRGDASAICDDPVKAQQILGKVVSVERHGHNIDLYSTRARTLHIAYTWASHLKRLILCLLKKWGQIFIFKKKHWGDLL